MPTIQDGLIVQWDGIDNVGIGGYDPSAKVWKNLAVNYDIDFVKLAETAKGYSLSLTF